jgi:hypothetical protein
MCTFKDEQTIQVCDVAIGYVRERLHETFGEVIHYTTVEGQGTLVQAPSTVDPARFQSATREAIAQAQNAERNGKIFLRDNSVRSPSCLL